MILGVYVSPGKPLPSHGDHAFLRMLAEMGEAEDCHVFLFHARNIDWRKREIAGAYWDHQRQQWARRRYRWPRLIYNRCLAEHAPRHARAALRRLVRLARAQLLQRQLPGKWRMHQLLRRHPRWSKLVPRTALWRGGAQLRRRLQQASSVILKPAGGSQGRGVLEVTRLEGERLSFDRVSVAGRDVRNRPIHRIMSLLQLKHTIGAQRYMLQERLNLRTRNHEPFDVRVFTQKNEHGEWQVRGLAVRIGASEGVTSNLAGGGRAEPAERFFRQHFDHRTAENLYADLHNLAPEIARWLDTTFTNCFELGLDFGITADGHIHLLEINGKPGRDVFALSGQHQTYRQTVAGVINRCQSLQRATHQERRRQTS